MKFSLKKFGSVSIVILAAAVLTYLKVASTSVPTIAETEALSFDSRRISHTLLGFGINAYAEQSLHLPLLRELNFKYVRIQAGPELAYGAPGIPSNVGLTEFYQYLNMNWNRTEPWRLRETKKSFRFFKKHDIKTILTNYHLPPGWLGKDSMRTMKKTHVPDLARFWTAHLLVMQKQGMEADFVEPANEPDGSWNGHIPPADYGRLLRRLRHGLDTNALENVKVLGPGTSSLDLEADPMRYFRSFEARTIRALHGWSAHGWDEASLPYTLPSQLDQSWVSMNTFLRLNSRRQKPFFLTEYAAKVNWFGDKKFNGAGQDTLGNVTDSPEYALRVLANTLIHINRGVSVPVLWRLSDRDSEKISWGLVAAKRKGGYKRPVYYAVASMFPHIPAGARVLGPLRPQNYKKTAASVFCRGKKLIIAMVNLSPEKAEREFRLRNFTNIRPFQSVGFKAGKIVSPAPGGAMIRGNSIRLRLPPQSSITLTLRHDSSCTTDNIENTAGKTAGRKGRARPFAKTAPPPEPIQTKPASIAAPLIMAVKTGDLAQVQKLIRDGADVNMKIAGGETPLTYAAWFSRPEIARVLLEKGANPDRQTEGGATALMYALTKGNPNLIKLLSDSSNKLELKDRDGYTALMYASGFGRKAAVLRLLERGARINAQDDLGRTALMHSIRGEHFTTVRNLIRAGADLRVKDNKEESVLVYGIRKSQPALVHTLLKAGADANQTNMYGETPLMLAALSGQTRIARFLLDKGARTDIKDSNGNYDALTLARRAGRREVMRLFESVQAGSE